ncbi:hypothetical protein Tco_1262780 [Tanacetum coccineum]
MRTCGGWNEVVDRFNAILSTWNAKNLSIGGDLCSLSRCLKWEVGDFIIEQGALWQVVIKRYFSDNGGFGSPLSWAVKKGVWYDIVKVVLDIDDAVPPFKSSFHLKIFNGSNTYFWKDPWCGNGVCLKDSFLRLFALANHQDCKVKDRHVSTAQSCKFTSDDAWTWTWDCSRKFKVKSLAVTVQNSILSDARAVPSKSCSAGRNIKFGVRSLVLMQQLSKESPTKLGDEGLSFGRTKLISIFITVEAKLEKKTLSSSPLDAKCQHSVTSNSIDPKKKEQLRQAKTLVTTCKEKRFKAECEGHEEARLSSMAALRAEKKAKLKESRTPLVGFSGEVSYPIGIINLNMTMGEPGRLQTIPMEFEVVKSHSPYNVILGRTSLRSLGGVASTIHSMIKFPTTNRIATMTTKKETLQECQRMEEAQGPVMEGRTIPPKMKASESEGTTSKGKEGSRGHTDKTVGPDDIIQPSPISSNKYTQAGKKDKGEDEGGDS